MASSSIVNYFEAGTAIDIPLDNLFGFFFFSSSSPEGTARRLDRSGSTTSVFLYVLTLDDPLFSYSEMVFYSSGSGVIVELFKSRMKLKPRS